MKNTNGVYRNPVLNFEVPIHTGWELHIDQDEGEELFDEIRIRKRDEDILMDDDDLDENDLDEDLLYSVNDISIFVYDISEDPVNTRELKAENKEIFGEELDNVEYKEYKEQINGREFEILKIIDHDDEEPVCSDFYFTLIKDHYLIEIQVSYDNKDDQRILTDCVNNVRFKD